MSGSQRKWKTTINGRGSTPSEALAVLLEDPYADRVKDAIYLRPDRQATIEDLAGGSMGEIMGWTASTDVVVTGAIDE